MDRTITQSEILEALQDAMDAEGHDRDPNTYTRRELEQMWGRGPKPVSAALKRLITEGRVERVMVWVEDIGGLWQRRPAYHFKNGKPE